MNSEGPATASVSARLRRTFDTERLVADLDACRVLRWVPEAFPDADSGGLRVNEDWDVLPLRSRGGTTDDGTAGATSLEPYRDTPYMSHTPYVGQVVRDLGCSIRSVRLSALRPGTKIREHIDPPDCLEKGGDIRLHVPIVTNDDVYFVVGGHRMQWQPGELWYADFSQPHSVENRGDVTRVHLLICVGVSRPLLDLFPPEYLVGRPVANLTEAPGDRRADFELTMSFDADNKELRQALDRLPEPMKSQLAVAFANPVSTRYVGERLTLETSGGHSFALDSLGDGRFKVADLPAHLELSGEGRSGHSATLTIDFIHSLIELPAVVVRPNGPSESQATRPQNQPDVLS